LTESYWVSIEKDLLERKKITEKEGDKKKPVCGWSSGEEAEDRLRAHETNSF